MRFSDVDFDSPLSSDWETRPNFAELRRRWAWRVVALVVLALLLGLLVVTPLFHNHCYFESCV